MELKKFAFEKIGFSRKYPISDIKRKFKPAITELEKLGYIKSPSTTERYEKIRRGEWKIHFERAEPEAKKIEDKETQKQKQIKTSTPEPETTDLICKLIEHGVAASRAKKLVREYGKDRIQEKIELLEYKIEKGDKPKNNGAFLASAIKDNYEPPNGFLTKAQKAAEQTREEKEKAEAKARKEAQEKAQAAKEAQEQAEKDQKEQMVQDYLNSLPEQERKQVIADALARADMFQKRILDRNSSSAPSIREILINQYVLELLETQPSHNTPLQTPTPKQEDISESEKKEAQGKAPADQEPKKACRVQNYLNSLSKQEREQVIADALALATPMDTLDMGKNTPLAHHIRESLIHRYVLKLLETPSSPQNEPQQTLPTPKQEETIPKETIPAAPMIPTEEQIIETYLSSLSIEDRCKLIQTALSSPEYRDSQKAQKGDSEASEGISERFLYDYVTKIFRDRAKDTQMNT